MAQHVFESIGKLLGDHFAETAAQQGVDLSNPPAELSGAFLHIIKGVPAYVSLQLVKWVGASFLFRFLPVESLLSLVTSPRSTVAESRGLGMMQLSVFTMVDIAIVITVICGYVIATRNLHVPEQHLSGSSARPGSDFYFVTAATGCMYLICGIVYAFLFIFNIKLIIFSATMSLCAILYYRGLIKDGDVAVVAFFASADAGVAVAAYCLASGCVLSALVCLGVVGFFKGQETMRNRREELPFSDDPPLYTELPFTDDRPPLYTELTANDACTTSTAV